VVCSPLAALTVQRYDPAAMVAVVPSAVRPQFYRAPSRAVARVTLCVPERARCVLLTAGGRGLGPLAETAESLATAGYQVLAVSGSNRRLQGRLAAAAQRAPRIAEFGTTDEVPALMSAADVVVTRARGGWRPLVCS
ncbi:MAG: glycosyl hydrolase, partial [Acidimicrobiales bacterium]